MKFTGPQQATILAALRSWQVTLASLGAGGNAVVDTDQLGNFADHFHSVEPLTADEIDTLCEDLNPTAQEEEGYVIIGPDGIPLDPEPYPTLQHAIIAAAGFPLRYLHQGHYKDARMQTIALEDLPELLRVRGPEKDPGLPSPEHLAFTMLREIGERPDLLACRSFGALHDHCDANTLGDSEKYFVSGSDDATHALYEATQTLVDRWLFAHHEKTKLDSPVLAIVWDSQAEYSDPKLYVPPQLSHMKVTCFDKSEEDTGHGDPVGPHHAALLEAGDNDRFPDYVEAG